jgi:aspartyl protease family protein
MIKVLNCHKVIFATLLCLFLQSCNGNLDEVFKIDDAGIWGDNTSDSNSFYSNNQKQSEELNFFESDNELKMEVENGVRYVWIKINGLNLRFIFDTGASSICISPAEVAVLYRQGTLKKEDILDIEYFQDATGRISAGTKIILREVQIGNKVLKDVSATVVNNIDAPLLMGQSILERFGSIEIDNANNKIIFK